MVSHRAREAQRAMTNHTQEDIALRLLAASSVCGLEQARRNWVTLRPEARAGFLRMADAALAIRDEAVASAVIDVGDAIEA